MVFKFSVFTSTLPEVGSNCRNKTFNKVDLPLPVRPIIPIFSPALNEKCTSSNTFTSLSSYLKVKWLNVIFCICEKDLLLGFCIEGWIFKNSLIRSCDAAAR